MECPRKKHTQLLVSFIQQASSNSTSKEALEDVGSREGLSGCIICQGARGARKHINTGAQVACMCRLMAGDGNITLLCADLNSEASLHNSRIRLRYLPSKRKL